VKKEHQALPIEKHGFTPLKGAFVDALALRYLWTPLMISSSCVGGACFTVERHVVMSKMWFPYHQA